MIDYNARRVAFVCLTNLVTDYKTKRTWSLSTKKGDATIVQVDDQDPPGVRPDDGRRRFVASAAARRLPTLLSPQVCHRLVGLKSSSSV